MTIDEAIKHCLEVAEENDLAAGTYEILAENNHNAYEKLTAETNSFRCAECAADHRQLAEWLTELKELRNSVGAFKLVEMKDALNLISEYKTELFKAKRLLKAAVEDMNSNNICFDINACNVCTEKNCISCDTFHWRYTDEALKLIGGSENG